jgi:hypothetical protein
MDELNNLKPSNFKEFLKGSSKLSMATGAATVVGVIASAFVGGVTFSGASVVISEYANERRSQKKDIATLQNGVAGKTVYFSKKDYKKAIKNPGYDGNAVLITSRRFKKYVVENSEALGVGEIKTSNKKQKI